jgi:hypothetical protein
MKQPERSIAPNKERGQDWEVLNPSGSIEVKTATLAPRLTTLEGKTILLRWNFKHNGNHFLDRIAERLGEQVPSAKVIKLYEMDRSTISQSGSLEDSARLAGVVAGLKPDLVISAHAD